MANLGKVVYLSEQQKNELFTNNTITVDGVTINYSDNDIYATPGDDTSLYCSATLSSAGWYRVMKTKDVSGTIINFYIGRPWDSNPAEVHKISFYTAGGGKSAFLDETSDTNTLCVDKIRATYGDVFMYFDVHYNASSANEVLVYFDVYGKGQANGTSIAMGLESVADAPSGETVLTEYVFASNTSIVDVGSSGGVNHSYRRSGNVVVIGMVSPGGKSLSQNVYTTVATLPIGLRPLDVIDFAADNTGGTINIGGRIQLNGNIELYPTNGSTSYWRFNVAYIV